MAAGTQNKVVSINVNRSTGLVDSEVRRYNNKLRRQKIVRRQWAILTIIAGILVGLAVVMATTLLSEARSSADDIEYKYYTVVEVASGDTLWDISSRYMTTGHYKDMNDYISEVSSINHLSDDYKISAGDFIVMPYYSAEFK
jgi:LysM repeat protein